MLCIILHCVQRCKNIFFEIIFLQHLLLAQHKNGLNSNIISDVKLLPVAVFRLVNDFLSCEINDFFSNFVWRLAKKFRI